MESSRSIATVSANLLDGQMEKLEKALERCTYDRTGAIEDLKEIASIVTEIAKTLRESAPN